MKPPPVSTMLGLNIACVTTIQLYSPVVCQPWNNVCFSPTQLVINPSRELKRWHARYSVTRRRGRRYFSQISSLDEFHFEKAIVCFPRRDVDTPFAQKGTRRSGEECQSAACSPAFLSSLTRLVWRGDPRRLQVWILVGTWDPRSPS